MHSLYYVESLDFKEIKIELEMIKIALAYPCFIPLLLLLAACDNLQKSEARENEVTVRDTTITKATSFSELFLDSATVEKFIATHEVKDKRADQLRSFYQSRNYQFAWFTEQGLAQQGSAFWNLHNNYVNSSRDSSFFNTQLHNQMRSFWMKKMQDLQVSR